MKLERNTKKTTASSTFEEDAIEIRKENLDLALQDLITYSNPIESIIREIISNCFDAHEEAGVDLSPVIKFEKEDLTNIQSYVSFIDYGLGMSLSKVKNIYGSLYESDKRGTNKYIGAFGIGSKSPLSYSDTYSVITTVDNEDGIRRRYTYLVSNKNTKFSITTLNVEETKAPTGTEVKIPVNSDDFHKFRNGILSQLRFFRRVKAEGFDIEEDNHQVEGDNFIVSTWGRKADHCDKIGSLHICLSQVYYPLDKRVIKEELNRREDSKDLMNSHVGLKMNIGEIEVTSKREAVKYTEDTIKKIADRYEDALEELREIDRKNNEKETFDELVEVIVNREADESSESVRLANDIYAYLPGANKDIVCKEIPEIKSSKKIVDFVLKDFTEIGEKHENSAQPSRERFREEPSITKHRKITNPFPPTYWTENNYNTDLTNWVILRREDVKNFNLLNLREEDQLVKFEEEKDSKENEALLVKITAAAYSNELMRLFINTEVVPKKFISSYGLIGKNSESKRLFDLINTLYKGVKDKIKEKITSYESVVPTQEEIDQRKQERYQHKQKKKSNFSYKRLVNYDCFRRAQVEIRDLNESHYKNAIYGFNEDRKELNEAYWIKVSDRYEPVIMIAKNKEKTFLQYNPNARYVKNIVNDPYNKQVRRRMTQMKIGKEFVSFQREIKDIYSLYKGVEKLKPYIKDLDLLEEELKRLQTLSRIAPVLNGLYDRFKERYNEEGLWLDNSERLFDIYYSLLFKFPFLKVLDIRFGPSEEELQELGNLINTQPYSAISYRLITKLQKFKDYAIRLDQNRE